MLPVSGARTGSKHNGGERIAAGHHRPPKALRHREDPDEHYNHARDADDGHRGGSETLWHAAEIQRGHGTDLIPHGYLARRNASTIVSRCTCHAGTRPAARPTSTSDQRA